MRIWRELGLLAAAALCFKGCQWLGSHGLPKEADPPLACQGVVQSDSPPIESLKVVSWIGLTTPAVLKSTNNYPEKANESLAVVPFFSAENGTTDPSKLSGPDKKQLTSILALSEDDMSDLETMFPPLSSEETFPEDGFPVEYHTFQEEGFEEGVYTDLEEKMFCAIGGAMDHILTPNGKQSVQEGTRLAIDVTDIFFQNSKNGNVKLILAKSSNSAIGNENMLIYTASFEFTIGDTTYEVK